jgi:hypothetical protein
LLVDSAKQQWHLPAAFVWQDSLVPFDPASINGDPPPSRPTILSSLCGGQLDGLEKDCNFYSFENPSSLSGKHYGLFSRPPIVPIFVPTAPVIAGPDTGPDSKLAPAHNTPTCWKCGNLLQNGVPDTLCDACAFFDWELFDSEATNFSAASPLLQTNSCQPTNKSGELEPSSQAASEFGHEIFTGFRSLISSGDSLQHHVPSGSTFQDYDQDVRGIIPQSLVTDGVQNKTKSRQSHPGELRGLYCSYCMAQRSASSVLVCTCGRLFDDAHYYPETDSTKNKPTQSNSPMWRVGNNSTEQSSGYVRYKTNDIKCYTSSDRVEPRFSTLRDKFSVFRAFLV